jgi:hypothetical protein
MRFLADMGVDQRIVQWPRQNAWSYHKGVPDQVTAALMGHSNVCTTLNVYTQVIDDSKKAAAERIGKAALTARSIRLRMKALQ